MALVLEGIGAPDSSSPYQPAVFGPTLLNDAVEDSRLRTGTKP